MKNPDLHTNALSPLHQFQKSLMDFILNYKNPPELSRNDLIYSLFNIGVYLSCTEAPDLKQAKEFSILALLLSLQEQVGDFTFAEFIKVSAEMYEVTLAL